MTETAIPRVSPPVAEGPVGLARPHFVGVGGRGMLPLARLCRGLGHRVSGSDLVDGPGLRVLEAEGCLVSVGHAAEQVPADASCVVFSSAVGMENPEIRAAFERGLAVVHRSRVLDALMAGRRAVGVAGTHGKTTTAAMLGFALARLGLDPTYVVGGELEGPGSGARLGAGDVLVAEVDESDGSFRRVHADLAVVTSVEFDHPETYAHGGEYREAFAAFLGNVPPGGAAVLDADFAGSRELLGRAWRDRATVVTFGRSPDADWRIRDVRTDAGGSRATVLRPDGGSVAVRVPVPGVHQLHAATAAIAVAGVLGVDAEDVAAVLERFPGVHRRFNLLGVVAGTRAYDSYAHHPTAVAADLAAARAVAGPEGRVLVVFQPGSQVRLAMFRAEFGRALAGADLVVLTATAPVVFASTLGRLAGDIRRAGGAPEAVLADRRAAVAAVAGAARPGDVVLLMGTGDLADHGQELVSLLAGPVAV